MLEQTTPSLSFAVSLSTRGIHKGVFFKLAGGGSDKRAAPYYATKLIPFDLQSSRVLEGKQFKLLLGEIEFSILDNPTNPGKSRRATLIPRGLGEARLMGRERNLVRKRREKGVVRIFAPRVKVP